MPPGGPRDHRKRWETEPREVVVRSLKLNIPRFADQHRAGDPAAVLEYVRALIERLGGPLGKEARPVLRDLCDIELAITRKRRDLDDALRKPNRKALARRIERDLQRLRFQRLRLEQRLEELAAARKAEHGDVAAMLAAMRPNGSASTP